MHHTDKRLKNLIKKSLIENCSSTNIIVTEKAFGGTIQRYIVLIHHSPKCKVTHARIVIKVAKNDN